MRLVLRWRGRVVPADSELQQYLQPGGMPPQRRPGHLDRRVHVLRGLCRAARLVRW